MQTLEWNTLDKAAAWLSHTTGEEWTAKRVLDICLEIPKNRLRNSTFLKAAMPRDTQFGLYRWDIKNNPGMRQRVMAARWQTVPLYPSQVSELLVHGKTNVSVALRPDEESGTENEWVLIEPLDSPHVADDSMVGITAGDLRSLLARLSNTETIDAKASGGHSIKPGWTFWLSQSLVSLPCAVALSLDIEPLPDDADKETHKAGHVTRQSTGANGRRRVVSSRVGSPEWNAEFRTPRQQMISQLIENMRLLAVPPFHGNEAISPADYGRRLDEAAMWVKSGRLPRADSKEIKRLQQAVQKVVTLKDFVRLCIDERLSIPDELATIVTGKPAGKPPRKLTPAQQDKLDCQKIVTDGKLWEKYNYNKTAIINSNELAVYRKQWPGVNTLGRWLKEIDPRPPETRRGRPSKNTRVKNK
jgi:hypothetical protein